MSGDAKLELKIPEQLITDTIRAEIIRQIPNKDEFAAAVIRSALEQPDPNDRYGYGSKKKTVFQAAVEKMIQDEAHKVFAEWLNQHRADIRKALVSELTRSKAAKVVDIAQKIIDGISKFDVSVSFKAFDG